MELWSTAAVPAHRHRDLPQVCRTDPTEHASAAREIRYSDAAWLDPFPCPKRRQTLGTQKNQRHAPCPQKTNRTAVGLVPAIHVLLLHKGSKGRGCPGQARARRGGHVLRQRRSAVGIPAPDPVMAGHDDRGTATPVPDIASLIRATGPRPHNGRLSCFLTGISTCLFLSRASARAMRRRVECGMMTSSM